VLIQGEGGHAGAMLMPDRRDALCAASELILALEAAAKATGAIDTVATVGICEVFPGAINSVPSRVRLEVDVRDTDVERRDGVLEALSAVSREVSSKRGVRIDIEKINSDLPAVCDEVVLQAIEEAASAVGRSVRKLISRAYHDTLFMAQIAPVAMIFIPCRGGVSHRPDEYSSPEWIAGGVEVLARTLANLAA
jgi:ureidoglycolate amidohydrolase